MPMEELPPRRRVETGDTEIGKLQRREKIRGEYSTKPVCIFAVFWERENPKKL
jgi:hypothetical protein